MYLYNIARVDPNIAITPSVLERNTGNVTAVGFCTKGDWLFSADEEGNLRIWDTKSTECQKRIENKFPISGACLHPNQAEIVFCDEEGFVKIWDLASDSCDFEIVSLV